MPGWVPDYEVYSAMIHAQHTETTWAQLSWSARARAVAHLRLSRLIALHESDAVNRAAKPPKK